MKTHMVTAGSEVLYHGTTSSFAVSILEQGRFRLSVGAGKPDEDRFGKNLYYLSTARSRYSDYIRSNATVIFELDGKKLGQRYRIVPVNYFNEDVSEDEMEDRILSTKPFIPATYIKAVFIQRQLVQPMSSNAAKIKRLCVYRRIPVYSYSGALIHREPVPLSKIPNDQTESDHVDSEARKIAKLFVKIVISPPNKRMAMQPLSGKVVTEVMEDIGRSDPLRWVLNSEFSDIIKPVIDKMRKNGWNSIDLLYYVIVKHRYMVHGVIALLYVYQLLIAETKRDRLKVLADHVDIIIDTGVKEYEAEYYLIKELGIYPELISYFSTNLPEKIAQAKDRIYNL